MVSNTEDGPLDKKFEKLVKETLEIWHVPGVSVAVVDGETTYAQVNFSLPTHPMLILFLLGLRYRIHAYYPYDGIYTLLRRQHHQGIHRRRDGASS